MSKENFEMIVFIYVRLGKWENLGSFDWDSSFLNAL